MLFQSVDLYFGMVGWRRSVSGLAQLFSSGDNLINDTCKLWTLRGRIQAAEGFDCL